MSIAQPSQKAPDKLPAGWSIRPANDKTGGPYFKVYQHGRFRLSFPSYVGAYTFATQSTARRSNRQERSA